jgi:DNA-binding response OmpR family regulator
MKTTMGMLRFGQLELDPEGFSVRVDGQDISLTFGEFVLLQEFLLHPYQVLDRRRLATLVQENVRGTGSFSASYRSVDTHIARIRSKLRETGIHCIKTMRHVGYRFVPPHGTGQGQPALRNARGVTPLP